jgi:hypothetical protein
MLACVVACGRVSSKPDAAPPASSATIADAAAPEAGHAEIDVIWGTSALVGVSSFVDNDRDMPEHIADHDASTAWNSNTGDLVGGWFGVRLGHGIYIHDVAFTVGFDKKTDTEDLFTANYRITRVRVDCVPDDGASYSPKALREVDVDPEVRAPQRVLVDAACWDLKLVVTGVKPGTHAGWRELAVSELAIHGWEQPGASKYRQEPMFGVGPNYLPRRKASLYHGATYEDACAQLVAAEDEDAKPVHCGPATAKQTGRGAMIEIARVPYSNNAFHGELIAFRTASGAYIAWARTSGTDTTEGTDYRFKSQAWSGDAYGFDVIETYKISSNSGVQHVVCHPAKEPWCTITNVKVEN